MTVPDIPTDNTFQDHGDGTRHLRRPGESFLSWQGRRLTNTRTFASLDQESENSQMKRVLTAKDLSAMGIGAIIGTGIFVLTGKNKKQKEKKTPSQVVEDDACFFPRLFSTLHRLPGSSSRRWHPLLVCNVLFVPVMCSLLLRPYKKKGFPPTPTKNVHSNKVKRHSSLFFVFTPSILP